MDYLLKKLRKAQNGNIAKSVKTEYWCTLAIHPEEIFRAPSQIIDQLQKEKEASEIVISVQNNKDSYNNRFYLITDRASQLHDAMNQQKQETRCGKQFVEVGQRQQQRHLKQMRKPNVNSFFLLLLCSMTKSLFVFFREQATHALWFAKTYGLTLKSLQLEDNNGSEINVHLCNKGKDQKQIVKMKSENRNRA